MSKEKQDIKKGLPKGWEWKKIGSIAETTSGGTPNRSTKYFWGGSIPWLKSGELTDGLIETAEEFITEEGLKKSSAKLFEKGTLLLALYGATAGKLGILNFNTTTNQAICAIKNSEGKFDTKYLYYFLLQQRPQIIKDSFGGAQPNISQGYIRDLAIPLPPLPEQQRIVKKIDSLFERLDKAIALTEENLEHCGHLLPAALNEVFGEAYTKYGIKKLSEISFLKNGYAFKSPLFNTEGRGYQVIRIGNVLNINKNQVFIEPSSEYDKARLNIGDIIISMTGTRTKKDYLFVSIINKENYYLNQRVGAITADKSIINEFIYYYLQSSLFRDVIFDFETGTVNQGNISGKDIMNMKCPIPDLPTQHRVVNHLNQLSAKQQMLQQHYTKQLQHLQSLKASLLDAAFRGEL